MEKVILQADVNAESMERNVRLNAIIATEIFNDYLMSEPKSFYKKF